MIRWLLAFARGENPVKGQKRGRAIKDAVSEGRQFNRRAAQSFIFVVIASLLILGRWFGFDSTRERAASHLRFSAAPLGLGRTSRARDFAA